MVSSSSAPPPSYRRMSFILPCVVITMFSVSAMLLYSDVVPRSRLPGSLAPGSASAVPFAFSIPRGECNGTLFSVTGSKDPMESSPPSLYCRCLNHAETGSNVTLECPKVDQELQFVDREVIKEVKQDCPVCANDTRIVEKEVVKEIEKECPEPETRIVEKEVIKEVEKECSKPETQIVEKEVIKEIEKQCPEPETRIVEKEVIKEIEKECPKPETQIVEKEVVQECPKTPWYAKGRNWHYPASLPLCSMDSCFNYSRCDNADDLLIYTYYRPFLEPQKYFRGINESKYHTDDPEKACLFLVPFDNIDPWHFQKVEQLPYWNGGMNHIVLIFCDKYRRLAPTDEMLGNASIMASDMQETMFRPGFDISIPLQGKRHLREFQPISALQRKYLLTFRGTRYLGFTDDGIFRSYKEFREMHNGDDVIVATNCDHATNDYLRREHPELGEGCDEDKEVWRRYDFADLMNTTFALVPAGRQPSSYRFIEVLAAGSIPVLIADNYVKPFDNLIPWYTCAIQFPTTEIKRIVNTLRKVSPEEKLKRQRNCLEIYNQYLTDDETLFKTAIRALKARFMGALPHLTEVRRR